jgi:deoxyribodipyrimidine photolyase-related protein
MSDYCGGCAYAVTEKTGQRACPFNYLYWDFLDRNRPALGRNPRLAQPYRTWDGMSEERQRAVRESAARFLDTLAG